MTGWLDTQNLLDSPQVAGLDQDLVEATFPAVCERIERFTGAAWTPQTTSEQLRGDGTRAVYVTRVPARSLDTVTVDGEQGDPAQWTLWSSGRLARSDQVIPRGALVDVTFEHGHDQPPADLLDAALRATATLVGHRANPRVGERTETIDTPSGQTINFAALPDWSRDRPFGMPDVDFVVVAYAGDRAGVGQRPVIA